MSRNLPAIDLVALIESRSQIRLSRVAATDGGEYKGPCPWCGGVDRFFVQPHHELRPHYHCRQCGRNGDALQFLRDWEGLSFQDALLELQDLESKEHSPHSSKSPSAARYSHPTPARDDPPPPEWQQTGLLLTKRAQRFLWSDQPEASAARTYLAQRGFSETTIKTARLGYCPLQANGRWYQAPLEQWGLGPHNLQPEQLAKQAVRIPPGIVLPWLIQTPEDPTETLWKLAIKRPGETPDYGQVLGSREGFYLPSGLAPASLQGKIVLLVEGEFDALSLWQAIQGDETLAADVLIAATGSASRGRSPRWLRWLKEARLILVAFDKDEAGEKGAQWWLQRLPQAMRHLPPLHDPNDMLQHWGEDHLRKWVQMVLNRKWAQIAHTMLSSLLPSQQGQTESRQGQAETLAPAPDPSAGSSSLPTESDLPTEKEWVATWEAVLAEMQAEREQLVQQARHTRAADTPKPATGAASVCCIRCGREQREGRQGFLRYAEQNWLCEDPNCFARARLWELGRQQGFPLLEEQIPRNSWQPGWTRLLSQPGESAWRQFCQQAPYEAIDAALRLLRRQGHDLPLLASLAVCPPEAALWHRKLSPMSISLIPAIPARKEMLVS